MTEVAFSRTRPLSHDRTFPPRGQPSFTSFVSTRELHPIVVWIKPARLLATSHRP